MVHSTLHVSIPVPPLIEPGTPLPTLPILAAHTSITSVFTEPKKLAAHETLPLNMPIAPLSQVPPVTPRSSVAPPSRMPSVAPPTSRMSSAAPPSRMPSVAPPGRMPSVAPPSRMPSVAPTSPVMKSPTVRFRTLTPGYSDLTSLPSDAESDSSSEGDSSETSSDRRIPKPPGEAGRPSRGGYTLKIVLDWMVKDYKKLKVSIECAVPLLYVNALYCRKVYTKESRIILIIPRASAIRILLLWKGSGNRYAAN
jgi:hypothetical protein